MEIRSLPISYGLKWLLLTWAIVKRNYAVALTVTLLSIFMNGVVNSFPIIGSTLSSFVGIILSVGLITISKNAFERKPVLIEDLFIGFKDNTQFMKVLPIAIANGMIGFALSLPKLVSDFMGEVEVVDEMGILIIVILGFTMALTFVSFNLFTGFAIPLLIFNDIGFADALVLSFKAFFKNILPYTFFIFCGVSFLMISALPLLLGLFVSIPVFMFVSYSIYGTIFGEIPVDKPVEFHE